MSNPDAPKPTPAQPTHFLMTDKPNPFAQRSRARHFKLFFLILLVVGVIAVFAVAIEGSFTFSSSSLQEDDG